MSEVKINRISKRAFGNACKLSQCSFWENNMGVRSKHRFYVQKEWLTIIEKNICLSSPSIITNIYVRPSVSTSVSMSKIVEIMAYTSGYKHYKGPYSVNY